MFEIFPMSHIVWDFASNAHITLAKNVQLREDFNKNSLPLLHQANFALRLMERVDLQESGRTQKQCITNAPRCFDLVEPVEISMCKNNLIMGRYLEAVSYTHLTLPTNREV